MRGQIRKVRPRPYSPPPRRVPDEIERLGGLYAPDLLEQRLESRVIREHFDWSPRELPSKRRDEPANRFEDLPAEAYEYPGEEGSLARARRQLVRAFEATGEPPILVISDDFRRSNPSAAERISEDLDEILRTLFPIDVIPRFEISEAAIEQRIIGLVHGILGHPRSTVGIPGAFPYRRR